MAEPTLTLYPFVIDYTRGRLRRAELQPDTVRNYRRHLVEFAESFGARPIDKLGPRAVENWLERIAQNAPGTRQTKFTSVRRFCEWLVATDVIKRNPTVGIQSPRIPRKVPRALPEHVVHDLLAHAADERENLILWFMVGCGLRAVEISRMQHHDVDTIEKTVRVRGKGGHVRVVPLPDEVLKAFRSYVATTSEINGPVIQHAERPHQGLSAARTAGIAAAVIKRAGVKARPYDGVSPHALRATAASDVLARSKDLTVVKEMLGHANLATTSIYLRNASLGDMRAAMAGRSYDNTTIDETDQRVDALKAELEELVERSVRDGVVNERAKGRRLLARLLLIG
jgi:integrase/recombinase XerC